MSDDLRIQRLTEPTPADSERIRAGLVAFNLKTLGPTDHFPVVFHLLDDDGAFLGGITGDVWLRHLTVEFLWVDESLRGQGHGHRLLQQAEAYAIECGATVAYLDTFDFQAGPAYYERQGYEAFGSVGEPTERQSFFMRKQLAGMSDELGRGAAEHAGGIRLVALDAANWQQAVALRVAEEQVPFVVDQQPVAMTVLAKAYVRPGGDDWEPLGFVDTDDTMVGLVLLRHREGRSAADGTGSSELRHFFIDLPRQGAGLGGQALAAVVAYVQKSRPRSRRLELTAHPDNEVAQRLYRGAGFAPTGELREGEPVLAMEL